MKRRELVRQMTAYGAVLVREGAGHTIYENPRTHVLIPVPRHAEVNDNLARKILRDAAK
jgi:predicted RNA binding protein YcfA (HicA-like mRNA interferase family)